jgi:hypothetical protein
MLPGVVVEVAPMQENDVGFVVVTPFEVLSVVPHPVLGHVVPENGT